MKTSSAGTLDKSVQKPENGSRSYRVGNLYRDKGRIADDDEFQTWLNNPGSGINNSSGIRPLRYLNKISDLPACLILVTHERTGGPKNPWEDVVDYSAGEIIYWGDAKADENRRHNEFLGNRTLEKIFHAYLDGKRHILPPILHFSKPKKGYVKFSGLCALDRLELSWFDDHGKPVRNYRAHLTILDEDVVPLSWIHHRVRATSIDEANKNSPAVWSMYTKGNVKKIDLWKGQVRSVEDQLPGEGTDEAEVLQSLAQLHPTRFEAAIVSMFRSMTSLVHTVNRTTPTSDGGFDFFGEFVMPRPLSYRISFRGEVKRYARRTAVGPGDVSRLVARLGRGEYGLFVTTSYFTKAAQLEVLADAYPVKLIAGIDLVNFLKELRLMSGKELRPSWLLATDEELDMVLSNR